MPDPFDRRALTLLYLDGLNRRQLEQRLSSQRTAVAVAVARALRVVAAAASVEAPAPHAIR